MFAHLRAIHHNLCSLGARIALIDPAGRSHDYAELGRRAAGLVEQLDAAGVQLGRPVGVALERGVAMVAAMIACWLRGHPYVPLDVEHPATRLRATVEDAGLTHAFVDPRTAVASRLREASVVALAVHGHAEPGGGPPSPSWVDPDPRRSAGPGPDPASTLAYVIFTSGSTGRPKGVMVDHANVESLLLGCQDVMGMRGDARVLCVTPCTFDIHVVEIWQSLMVGATLVMADDATSRDPWALRDFVERWRPSFMQMTPSRWRMLLATGWAPRWPVSTMVTAGEALDRALADALLERAEIVLDGYGPTETTVYSAFARVGPDALVFGQPLRNTAFYLVPPGWTPADPLPDRTAPVAGDEPRELWIGGDGVSRGYAARPELTTASFVRNPGLAAHAACGHVAPDGWIYRTGDLVALGDDGRLRFRGRADHQIKLHGYRVELGEIEAVLCEHPEVVAAATVVRIRAGVTELAAFVQPRHADGETPAAVAHATLVDRLREHLAARVPSYMRPSTLELLDPLPTTATGKIDRRALAERPPAPPLRATGPAPRTALESLLCEAFAAALDQPHVGLDDDFFALGGTSLLAARLTVQLRVEHQLDVPIRILQRHPTPAALAHVLAEHHRAPPISPASLRADAALPWAPLSPPALGSTVVLTGATGFIGAHVLRALLEHHDGEVLCLVRAASPAAGRGRIDHALAGWGLALREDERARILVVPADLSRDDLGLGAADRDRLTAADVGAFIHDAALVRLTDDYAGLRGTNVVGTQRLLELAAAGNRPRRFVFVSSLDVLRPWITATRGNRGGESFGEVLLDEPAAYRDGYSASKWVAEQLVARAGRELGLDSTIVRLGHVGAHSRQGVWPDDFFTRLMRGIAVLGAYPLDDARLSVIPVDPVARLLVDLAVDPQAPPRIVWHVNNPHGIELEALGTVLAARQIEARAVPHAEWVARLTSLVLDRGEPALAPLLELLAEGSVEEGTTYLQTTAIGSRRIDCAQATAWMKARGYPIPARLELPVGRTLPVILPRAPQSTIHREVG